METNDTARSSRDSKDKSQGGERQRSRRPLGNSAVVIGFTYLAVSLAGVSSALNAAVLGPQHIPGLDTSKLCSALLTLAFNARTGGFSTQQWLATVTDDKERR